MKIAVLALQGAFAEHETALHALGAETVQIRGRADFTGSFDGIIFPGGESTVQGKFLREEGLLTPMKAAIEGGMPAFGTCAGLILLANRIENDEKVHLGTMDVEVRRNAYGRQIGSFRFDGRFADMEAFPMVFIRGPYIVSTGENVQVLATVDGRVVAAREKNMLGMAFHPELTNDLRIHEYFLQMAEGKR